VLGHGEHVEFSSFFLERSMGEEDNQKFSPFPVFVDADEENKTTCLSACYVFRSLILDSYTWSCFFYFLCIKLPLALISFVWTLTSFAVSLTLMFNCVVIAACPSCYDPITSSNWGTWDDLKFLVNTYHGSVVTVPVGLILFLSCLGVLALYGRCTRRLAFHFLARKHKPLSSQNEKEENYNSLL